MAVTAGADLLDLAIGWRAGAGANAAALVRGLGDPPIAQWSASSRPGGLDAPSGGAGWTESQARQAAIGELLERVGSGMHPVPDSARDAIPAGQRVVDLRDFRMHTPDQVASPAFPHRASYAVDRWVRCFDLRDNSPVWVPTVLVTTEPSRFSLATSSGLAAGPGSLRALLRAVQELVERDALMTTWLFGVGARQVPPAEAVVTVAEGLAASVTVLDLTPAYSPHPVAAVAGSAPLAGRPRIGVGVACRASWDEAVDKALLEWAQAISFAGVTTAGDPPGLAPSAESVTGFDEHARFYTRRPDLWARLPWWDGPTVAAPPSTGAAQQSDQDQLRTLSDALASAGIDLFYRDLSTVDTTACGVRVVRLLSPDLAQIHADHRWPHLNVAADRAQRLYPDQPVAGFPSPFPHPLG